MLQGFGEMDVVAKIAVLNPVIQIVLVVPLALALPTAAPVAVVPALSFSVVAVVTDIAGRRKAAHSLGARLPFLVARLPRGFTASRLIGQSLSFLVISLGLVVAFQLQRVILAHFSGEAEMARYALVAQYLVPVLSIIGVVAQALWPRYRAQMGRIRGRDLLAHFSLFSLLGIVGAAVMVAALLVVSHLLLENVVALSPALLIAAAVYVIAFAAHQPSAMVLNDANGLRAQAFIVSIMAIVSLSCTLVFADSFGAAGAFFSLATAVVVFQLGPTLLLAARHIRLSRKYALIFSERVN
ncbi:MAG: hypothetical protein EON54_02145 [Alcaligenaceae bacterium]|nr:MAG: hypothetical protein EON54_02145 [Alcaligenaceae bacterium]